MLYVYIFRTPTVFICSYAQVLLNFAKTTKITCQATCFVLCKKFFFWFVCFPRLDCCYFKSTWNLYIYLNSQMMIIVEMGSNNEPNSCWQTIFNMEAIFKFSTQQYKDKKKTWWQDNECLNFYFLSFTFMLHLLFLAQFVKTWDLIFRAGSVYSFSRHVELQCMNDDRTTP